MESSKTLPADMFFEILSRASFETVERSKSVSKELREIINEPTFLPLHSRRTNSLFGYYFQNWRGHKVQSEFVSDDDDSGIVAIPDSMEILASCDYGMMCCMSRIYKKYRYYVCKPATHQWQALPNPKLRYQTVAVALVVVKSQPLHYMIVRISQYICYEHICEIFDSKNWAWEKIQGPQLPYEDFITSDNVSVTVGDSVYWLTANGNVLALDLNERSFRYFPLPETVNSDDGCNWKQLIKYDGGLGFAYLTKDRKTMEIWVAKRRQWTRKMGVEMKLVDEGLLCPRLVDFFSTDAAFMKIGDQVVWCNFRDCIFRGIKVDYDPAKYVKQIFRFRSDFETVDLKRPKMNERSESSVPSTQTGVRHLVQEFCAGLQRTSKTRLVSCFFPPRFWCFISI